MAAKGKTRLSDDVTKPSQTAPGEAPADTMDPEEMATSVTPDKAAAAKAGYGSVNAVVPRPRRPKPERDTSNDRTESYEVPGPTGEPVKVTRNLETGESTVEQAKAPAAAKPTAEK